MPIWVILLLLFLLFDLVLVFWIFVKKGRRDMFAAGDLKYIRSHWGRIVEVLQDDPKNAVLDADKLLDYALKKKGFEGNLGEKLKKAGSRFSDINRVWNAHKLRNRIAHEMMNLDPREAKNALASFKKGLNDLGAGL